MPDTPSDSDPAADAETPISEVSVQLSPTERGAREAGTAPTSQAQRLLSLPFRLLLVSDFTPSAGDDPAHAALAGPRRVDKHSFGPLMQEAAPTLTLEVDDHPAENAGEPQPAGVRTETLTFETLGDFAPEAVARQVPALDRLRRMRVLLEETQRGAVERQAFSERVEALDAEAAWADRLFELLTASSGPASKEDRPAADGSESAVDRILGMIDAEEDADASPAQEPAAGEEASPRALAARLAHAVAGNAEPPPLDDEAAGALASEIDALMRRQLRALVTAPAFRRLEASWRELKVLVDRIDFRAGAELDVMAASREDLDEALHERVLLPEHARSASEGEEPRAPLSAIVLGHRFGHTRADVQLLRGVAETGASLQAPVMASASPAFFGEETPDALGDLAPLRQLLSGPAYLRWRKLRERDVSSWLSLAVPPFVLRDGQPEEAEGDAASSAPAPPLWGGGAVLVAASAAGSYARTGWPTHLTGPRSAPLEDLALWQGGTSERSPRRRRASRRKRPAALPLAVALSSSEQAAFSSAGFVTLSATPGRDAVRVAAPAPVARDTDAAPDSARVRTSDTLPCQFFVARAAHFLVVYEERLADELRAEAEAAPEQSSRRTLHGVQAHLERHLRTFLRDGGRPERLTQPRSGKPATGEDGAVPDAAVALNPAQNEALPDDQQILAIRLQPPATALSEPARLVLGFELPQTVPEREASGNAGASPAP